MESDEHTAEAIELLLDAMERRHGRGWRSNELGERYDRLIKGVAGFRAEVIESRVKFKLGQNERSDVYDEIITGLENSGNGLLADAMRTFNERRSIA